LTPTTVGARKLDCLPFRVVSKYPHGLFGFVTKHTCDGQADRRRDRQTYDSKDCASIAMSRGNNIQ